MKQIARVSLVDSVVERLRDDIRSGAFPVGSKIPTEARLVTTYGVSRTLAFRPYPDELPRFYLASWR